MVPLLCMEMVESFHWIWCCHWIHCGALETVVSLALVMLVVEVDQVVPLELVSLVVEVVVLDSMESDYEQLHVFLGSFLGVGGAL